MIPVEFFWLALFFMFMIIGAARGLAKELGVTTILLLSLFSLTFAWNQLGARLAPIILKGPLSSAPVETAKALYYAIILIIVTFVSYEGFTLQFPVQSQKGLGKGLFGAMGGLLNGYLIVGTLWNVTANAGYFGLKVMNCGKLTAISDCLTTFHSQVVKLLLLTLIPWAVMLVLGMILLLAIVLR